MTFDDVLVTYALPTLLVASACLQARISILRCEIARLRRLDKSWVLVSHGPWQPGEWHFVLIGGIRTPCGVDRRQRFAAISKERPLDSGDLDRVCPHCRTVYRLFIERS